MVGERTKIGNYCNGCAGTGVNCPNSEELPLKKCTREASHYTGRLLEKCKKHPRYNLYHAK